MSSAAYCKVVYLVVSQIYVRVPCAPQYAPQRKNTCVLNASTLPYLTGILVSTFQLLYFPRYQGSTIYTRGPDGPRRPQLRNFFLPKASTSQYLIVILVSTFQLLYFPRYQGVPNLHQRALRPQTPPCGEIFVPKASTSQYLIVFLISTFQVQQFPDFMGVRNLSQEALCPPFCLQRKIFLYPRRVLYYVKWRC